MKMILLNAVTFLIFACNAKKKVNIPVTSNQTNVTNDAGKDTLVKDIPEFLDDSLFLQTSIGLSKKLGLPSLKQGFDEYQIRIWLHYNNYDTQQIIVLKREKLEWLAEFYSFTLRYNKEGESELVNKVVQTKTPKSGWPYLIDSLQKTGIEVLLDITKQKEKSVVSTHPDVITVEIATPKLYRIYQYMDFDRNYSKFTDMQKLREALLLIEKEFDFKRSNQIVKSKR